MERAKPVVPIADKIAAVLISGAHTGPLLGRLLELFDSANHIQVAAGVAMAFSDFETDRIGLVGDLMVAERRIAALQRKLGATKAELAAIKAQQGRA